MNPREIKGRPDKGRQDQGLDGLIVPDFDPILKDIFSLLNRCRHEAILRELPTDHRYWWQE